MAQGRLPSIMLGMDSSLAKSPLATGSRLRRAAAAAVLLLLTACAANYRTMNQVPLAPPYVAPAEGARATLLVRVTQPGGHYAVSSFLQPVSCSQRREIASGTATQPERVGTEIPAGRLQTLAFSFRRDRHICEVSMSFEPVRGRTYLLRGGVETQRCHLEIIDATASGTTEVPAVQRDTIGFGKVDNACKPLVSTELPRRAAVGERRPSIEDFRQLLPAP